MSRFTLLALPILFSLFAGDSLLPAADPLDWPNWRGPEQNGISREKDLLESWNPKGGPGSNLLWKRSDLGGRSTPIVMRGKLYAIVRDQPGTKSEGEKVVCLDAATGETIWENRFNVFLSDVPDTRVGWSCCVGDPETGNVYVLGVCTLFRCLDGQTGETRWERSMQEEFGMINTYGGRTNVPVVFEDTVIVNGVTVSWGDQGKPAHRFYGFDKKTGELRWIGTTNLFPTDTTYSTPIVTVLGGQAAIVFGAGDGRVWAMQPRTGKMIWSFPFSRRGLNTTPLVSTDGKVYMGHSEENIVGTSMGAFVSIDGTQKGDLADKELWLNYEQMVGKSSPLLIDDRLYVVDDRAKLLVLDAKTGKQIARQALGTVMRSSPLYADGKIYTCDNNGRWYILRPTDNGVKVIHQLRLAGEASDGSPIVSHGRIYLPTSENLYCIGKANANPVADPIPPQPKESSAGDDQTPAHVQVVPAEVLLRPGETQKFAVRLFNANGQFFKAAEAEFSLQGAGKIAADGTYAAPDGAEHSVAIVTAKLGDLSGTARVRVVPPLPWKWDFENLDDVPVSWIGGRVRHEVRDVNGNMVLVKRDNIPTTPGNFTKLGTRSRVFMGQDDLADYTIQADALLTEKEGKMPDLGIINQRYTLLVLGQAQRVRVQTWDSQLRMAKTIDFEWKPNTWYTMKLQVTHDDGKAIARGKIWPRGEQEPAEWTLEAEDPSPNEKGSPGLFGNTSDAEGFWDNISVTKNEK